MKIRVAEHSGYCYGVKRAVSLLENLIEEKSKVYTLGPIIHNQQVTDYYHEKGVLIIDKIADLSDNEIDGALVVIRSHGAPKSVYEEAELRGIKLKDATCPYVKKIQNTVSTYASKGYNIIIVGDSKHPEVIGINGWCDNQAKIIKTIDDVELITSDQRPTCVVAQTTFNINLWKAISDQIEAKLKDCVIINTICLATEQRQQAVIALASEVDLMIVVGGKHSSNTIKLAELCALQTKTIHIETKDDLNGEALKGTRSIGITAGASTPDWIIQSVILKIENEGEVFF